MISTRELAELPLVVWIAVSHHARQRRADRAHGQPARQGRHLLAVCRRDGRRVPRCATSSWLVAVAGLAGALAGVGYWARALRDSRTRARPR